MAGIHSGVPVRPPTWSWGLLLPAGPYTRCYRCRRPWWAGTEHVVNYGPSRGMFALCTWCWGRSDTWWRFHAHHWLIRSWASTPAAWTEAEAEVMYEAIEALDPVMTPQRPAAVVSSAVSLSDQVMAALLADPVLSELAAGLDAAGLTVRGVEVSITGPYPLFEDTTRFRITGELVRAEQGEGA